MGAQGLVYLFHISPIVDPFLLYMSANSDLTISPIVDPFYT
jgi:hypothetical protein